MERFLLWLALSAAAILLERITNCGRGTPPAQYLEDKEDENVLLRQKEDRVPGNDTDSSGF